MLQTTTDGNDTSDRGTVMVSTVVTTVAFMKSMVFVYRKMEAQPMARHTIRDQKICLNLARKYTTIQLFLPLFTHRKGKENIEEF